MVPLASWTDEVPGKQLDAVLGAGANVLVVGDVVVVVVVVGVVVVVVVGAQSICMKDLSVICTQEELFSPSKGL